MTEEFIKSTEAEDQATVPSPNTQTSGAATGESRDETAAKMVNRFAAWSGAAGFLPIPFVDVAAVGGLQLQMVRRLSQIYDVSFSENLGKSIVASLAGSAIPASSGMGVASALKFWPGVGTLVSALTMPALSAAATYAIGKAFIEHFKSGGTFLDFNPPDYHEFIKAQRDLFSSKPVVMPAGDNDAPSARAGAGAAKAN